MYSIILTSLLSAFGPTAQEERVPPTVINVEVDYMVDTDHSHALPQLVIDALVQMFACHGITLNIMISDAIPHVDVMQCPDPMGSFWDCTGPSSFATMEAVNRDTIGMSGWHYAIIGHNYANSDGFTSSSGRSNGLDNFIVTLGSFFGQTGTDFHIAGTFAHELGHDLGLGHASPDTFVARDNYSPNYASVMSYKYQLRGVKSRMEEVGVTGADHLFKELDYSNGRLPRVYEQALFEEPGFGIVPVDWDCNGLIQPGSLQRDIDSSSDWCGQLGGTSFIYDWNDWANIQDDTFAPGRRAEPDRVRDWECVGPPIEEPEQRLQVPTLSVEPCVSGNMYWLDPLGAPMAAGTGETPISSLSFAEFFAPPGSIFYFQPGTFTNGGAELLFTKEVLFAGVGTAVISP